MARLNTSEADLEIERANSTILRKRIPQENQSLFRQLETKPDTKAVQTQTELIETVQNFYKKFSFFFTNYFFNFFFYKFCIPFKKTRKTARSDPAKTLKPTQSFIPFNLHKCKKLGIALPNSVIKPIDHEFGRKTNHGSTE